MKIVKKVSLSKIKGIEYFDNISDLFNELSPKMLKQIGVSNVLDLNYFFVVTYKNILKATNDLNKFFSSDGEIKIDVLQKEHQRMYKYLTDRNKNGYPAIFNKMGLLNEVQGCYLVASNLKNVKNIDVNCNIDYGEGFLSLSVKLNNDKLPKEIEHVFSEYQKKQNNKIKKEFNDRTTDYGDINMEDLFLFNPFEGNDLKPGMLFVTLTPDHDLFITPDNASPLEEDENSPFVINIGESHKNTIENLVDTNLGKIYNMDFLSDILKTAELNENYELCAKIRDRIVLLNKK